MTAYYNEHDPFAAAWLRNLIAGGHIAAGDVDERSIVDVQPEDLKVYVQCHFFAGIGGWSLALRLAGWPDDRPVWTGSPPCQPYSVGSVAHGGAKGQADERHLWPTFAALIGERSPPDVFGEQVDASIEWGWWDEVCWDLEGKAYSCAAAVIPACAVEADHERKRLLWAAHSGRAGREGYKPVESVSVAARASLSILGDPFLRVGRAMAGDYGDLLRGDGVSVAVERCATKGYGNAIVAKVAAAFVESYCEAIALTATNDNNQERAIAA